MRVSKRFRIDKRIFFKHLRVGTTLILPNRIHFNVTNEHLDAVEYLAKKTKNLVKKKWGLWQKLGKDSM